MKKLLFVLALIFLPLIASAATSVPWSITNLTDKFIFPAPVNGVNKGVIVTATSTVGDGTQTGGLTINGGSTTTLPALFQGGGTLTVNNPALNVSQTWNNAGVVFTGLKVNVTATAASAASLIQDWQTGGVSKASVRSDGLITLASLLGAGGTLAGGQAAGVTGFNVSNTSTFGWTSTAAAFVAADTGLSRLSAGVIGVGKGPTGNTNGTLIAGIIGIGSSTPFALLSVVATSTNGTGSPSNLFIIASTTAGTATTTLFSVSNTGTITSGIGSSASSTQVIVGKWQQDTYNTAGTEICSFWVGTTLTTVTGACNK